MTDVIYMVYRSGQGEPHLETPATLDEYALIERMKPGEILLGEQTLHVAYVDVGATRAAQPPTPVWVRVVCQTLQPLTEVEREAVRRLALLYGVKWKLIRPVEKGAGREGREP